MKKKGLFVIAAASLLAVTSCSVDEVVGGNVLSNNEINPTARIVGDVKDARAVETKITNLGEFTVNAFQTGEANYMNNVEYTTSDNGSSWTTAAGKFFWPVEGDLHLYGYAPAAPGKNGTFQIDKDAQTLTDFVPFATAAAQQDFVYAKSTGNNATNGTTGVELNFQHALTEISVAAKNSNTAYTVNVTGVKLGNVKTKGTFTFPSIANSAASWTLSAATEDVGSYETTWSTATELTSSVSTLDEANVAFMLLPQQLEKSEIASEKAYLALKVNITMQGGKVIHDGWSYIGLNTNWEMGKHYTYTVDFSDGAGQDEEGNQLISGKNIKLNVDVIPWNEKAIAYPPAIIGTATAAFSYKVGGSNGARYTVTPDASGNWSIPVTKFDGITDMFRMFEYCTSLTSLDLSHLNTNNVTNMGAVFYYSDNLTSVDLSGWNTSNVTNMQSMFTDCHYLTSLDLSSWDTRNLTYMGNMFQNCYKLKFLDLNHFDTSNVTDMNQVFRDCTSLTSLDVSGWNTEKVTSMHGMFDGCTSLTSLDVSGWNTEKVSDIIYMFDGCTNLKTIKMVGCSEATINKIKAQLATDGITSCTIVTE